MRSIATVLVPLLEIVNLLSSHVLAVNVNVTFDPEKVDGLRETEQKDVNFTVSGNLTALRKSCTVEAEDPSIVSVLLDSTCFLTKNEEDRDFGNFTLKGKFLGRTLVYLTDKDGWQSDPLPVSVVKEVTIFSQLHGMILAASVSLGYVAMGCVLDLEAVKVAIKRPTAILLGFCTQYLLMPGMAYGFGILFLQNPAQRLGLFTYGCSPGGGGSNMWTVLFEGNLNLSITMTLVSTVAALGMMPLWLFTLGRSIIKDTTISSIPFENIVVNLVTFVVPVALGIVIKWRTPRAAKICHRYILRPLSLLMSLYLIIFGIIFNSYIFSLITGAVAAAGICTAWLGFIVGGLGTLAFGFNKADAIAVAVETGIQNGALAMVMIYRSLKPPDSNMAAVVSIATGLFTPIPLLLIYICIKIRNCVYRKKGFNVSGRKLDDEMVVVKTIKDNRHWFLV